MNCVIICDNANHSGGVSSVVIAQAAGLKTAGYKVFVFAAYGPPSTLLSVSTEEVFCLYPEISRRGRLTEIWNKYAASQLSEYLVRFSPVDTIIHVHSISMGLSPSIATALRRRGIPYVITAHDAGWVCPTGYFYNFKTKAYCTYKPFSLACLSCNCDKKTYLHKAFKFVKVAALDYLSRIKQGATAIIAPSDLLRDRLVDRTPQSTPVITLLNPVNASNNGARSNTGDSFLFVGRIWEEKGISELLEAVGDDCPLTVVGDGPNKGALERKYPKVAFKGWLSPKEVMAEMRKAIALVLPSIYLEAFGLVVAEALSQGVPVIVSDRAGAATMVKHGYNGFLVDMGNPDEIRQCCESLLDKSMAKTMSRNAYSRYWENPLSEERYVSELLTIYRSAVPKTIENIATPKTGHPNIS
jgi:glycosyltransferase involved in cell wall biosynthesis